jgi:hypothetical protein
MRKQCNKGNPRRELNPVLEIKEGFQTKSVLDQSLKNYPLNMVVMGSKCFQAARILYENCWK